MIAAGYRNCQENVQARLQCVGPTGLIAAALGDLGRAVLRHATMNSALPALRYRCGGERANSGKYSRRVRRLVQKRLQHR